MKPSYPWPAMMRKETAAAYLDLSIAAFDREVISGILPGGHMFGGRHRWSKKQIDAALERLTGEGEYDWRKDTKLYGENSMDKLLGIKTGKK